MRKEHSCWGWCGQRLLGIVENGKLTGMLHSDSEFRVWSVRRFVIRTSKTVILTCQHGRSYAIRKTRQGGTNDG